MLLWSTLAWSFPGMSYANAVMRHGMVIDRLCVGVCSPLWLACWRPEGSQRPGKTLATIQLFGTEFCGENIQVPDIVLNSPQRLSG